MRQVVLDTETTGLDPALGHRIIEIAAVEVVNRRLTSNRFHRYINPERDSEEAALQIHGLTREFLVDKPKFQEIATDFLEFVSGSELIIHNAAFDVAFVNYELSLLGLQPVDACCPTVTDTLRMARDMSPGKRNSLDALCERYQVDHAARTLHGALLDAQLLAEVYLAMTRGQESLIVDDEVLQLKITAIEPTHAHGSLTVLRVDAEEMELHWQQLVEIDAASGGSCVWRRLTARETVVS